MIPDIILCTDQQGGISKDGIIPWKNKMDMKFFRTITGMSYNDLDSRNLLIMGNNTYNSIPTTFWNANRKALIISRDGLDIDQVYNMDFSQYGKVFIIGGSAIYNIAFRRPFGKIYHTLLEQNYNCDNKVDLKLISNVPLINIIRHDQAEYRILSHQSCIFPNWSDFETKKAYLTVRRQLCRSIKFVPVPMDGKLDILQMHDFGLSDDKLYLKSSDEVIDLNVHIIHINLSELLSKVKTYYDFLIKQSKLHYKTPGSLKLYITNIGEDLNAEDTAFQKLLSIID
jgi:dihydrofolate reductase